MSYLTSEANSAVYGSYSNMNELGTRIEKLTDNQRRLLKLMQTRKLSRGEKQYPLSYAQQRLWFLNRLDPANAAYNIPFALRLKGQLNRDALQRSLDEIMRRHEALRTSFTEQASGPVQTVAAEASLDIKEIDLRFLPESEREKRSAEVANQEANEVFDLSSAPLIRSKLLQLDQNEYVLLITMHHIIGDGWSTALLVREFSMLYDSYVNGRPSPLRDLALQYGDYALWQRQWLNGRISEGQLSYWKKQLADLPVLELPTDYPRSENRSDKADRVLLQYPAELMLELKSLGRRQGATLFMLLLSAWYIVLARHSGQRDITVGTAVANRREKEIDNLIGFFLNMLVMRANVGSNSTVSDLIRQVRTVALEAYENQDLPFEKVVEAIQPERSLTVAPLFQVLLVLQNTQQERLELTGLCIDNLATRLDVAKYDLDLTVSENAEELSGKLAYATGLFERETANSFVTHLRVALEQMVANSGKNIDELDLMSGLEREQIVVGWNQTVMAVDYEKCIHERIDEQAERTPDAIAVVFEEEHLSFTMLSQKANQLARYLQRQGIGPEVLVGLCIERNAEMIVTLLAVMKAGGAYVPLDHHYPVDRLEFMINDARLPVLLTTEQMFPQNLTSPVAVIYLEREQEKILQESKCKVDQTARADDLVYVLYTSGSTGRPKGVQITHRALTNCLASMQIAPGMDSEDILLAVTTLSFDIAELELYLPLLVGGQVRLLKREASGDGKKLLEALGQGVTVMQATPTSWQVVLDAGWQTGGDLKVFCAGEALSEALGEKLLKRSASTWNMYGPTETTIFSLIKRLEGENQPITVGRPIGNTTTYVLDEELRLLPARVTGDIYIGGAGLARGYVHEPALTACSFVPDPFSKNAGERLYKTGDLGTWRNDGTLQFLGRRDHQVKLRGHRIELGEIEALLNHHPGVKQAVVMMRKDEPAEPRLIAYAVALEGQAVEANELRAYLEKKLPGYMVPNWIVLIKEFPLTPNGKVDRKRLPAPESMQSSGPAVNYVVAPRNTVEQILCDIWADILKRDRVGITDNFFELGGHSLLAVQITFRIQHALHVDLPLRMFFEAGTPSAMAERITSLLGMQPKLPALSRLDRNERSELPLSYAQQRLWFVQQLEPQNAAYNVILGLELQGALDREAVRNSLNEILRRHEVLRTSFPVRDGVPVQSIAAEVKLVVKEWDLRNFKEEAVKAEAQRLVREEAGSPFDLGQSPLLRCLLLQTTDLKHLLILCVHHIVCDGWSNGIIVNELTRLYEAYVLNEKPRLPELTIQYGDFAVWQRGWLQGEALEEQLQYWRKQLAGAQPLRLPADYSTPAGNRKQDNSFFEVSSTLISRVKQLSQSEGVTLFMTLLAAFKLVVGTYAGQDDIVIGTDVANRSNAQIGNLIGFFANQLVLRTSLSGNPTFRELLQRVRDMSLDAYKYQDAPFEKIVEEVTPGPHLDSMPLSRIKFILQNTSTEPQVTGLQVKLLTIAPEIAKFDLMLTCAESVNGLRGVLEYRKDLFHQKTIELIRSQFLEVLSDVAQEPDVRISALRQKLNAMRSAENQTRKDDMKRAAISRLLSSRRRVTLVETDS